MPELGCNLGLAYKASSAIKRFGSTKKGARFSGLRSITMNREERWCRVGAAAPYDLPTASPNIAQFVGCWADAGLRGNRKTKWLCDILRLMDYTMSTTQRHMYRSPSVAAIRENHADPSEDSTFRLKE